MEQFPLPLRTHPGRLVLGNLISRAAEPRTRSIIDHASNDATILFSIQHKKKYQTFSLTAYNVSVQMFRRLVQVTARAATSKSVLAVISLVFTPFEAVQQRPTQIYESGWVDLKGTLTPMQKQGPRNFRPGRCIRRLGN